MKHLFDKQNKYSIRKLSIGVCSAVIGLSFLSAGTAYADGPSQPATEPTTGAAPVATAETAPETSATSDSSTDSVVTKPVLMASETGVLGARAAGETGGSGESISGEWTVGENEIPEASALEDSSPIVSATSPVTRIPKAGTERVAVTGASATNERENFPASNAVDNSLATAWIGETVDGVRPSLKIDLEKIAYIDRVNYAALQNGSTALGSQYYNESGIIHKGYIEYSTTGNDDDWHRAQITNVGSPHQYNKVLTDVAGGSGFMRRGNRDLMAISFKPVEARYLRLTPTESLVGPKFPNYANGALFSAGTFLPFAYELTHIEERVTETLTTDEIHYLEDNTRYSDESEELRPAVAGSRLTVTTYEVENGVKTDRIVGDPVVTTINPQKAVWRRGTLTRPAPVVTPTTPATFTTLKDTPERVTLQLNDDINSQASKEKVLEKLQFPEGKTGVIREVAPANPSTGTTATVGDDKIVTATVAYSREMLPVTVADVQVTSTNESWKPLNDKENVRTDVKGDSYWASSWYPNDNASEDKKPYLTLVLSDEATISQLKYQQRDTTKSGHGRIHKGYIEYRLNETDAWAKVELIGIEGGSGNSIDGDKNFVVASGTVNNTLLTLKATPFRARYIRLAGAETEGGSAPNTMMAVSTFYPSEVEEKIEVPVAVVDNRADADYTAVDAAISRKPADLSVYTDETANELTVAIDAVVRGKKIDEQETVTGYATRINAAVDALQLKPTMPSVTPVRYTSVSADALRVDQHSQLTAEQITGKIAFPAGVIGNVVVGDLTGLTAEAGNKAVTATVTYTTVKAPATVDVTSTNTSWTANGNNKDNVLTEDPKTFWASEWNASRNTPENREYLTLDFGGEVEVAKVRYQSQWSVNQHGQISKGYMEYKDVDGQWHKLDLTGVTGGTGITFDDGHFLVANPSAAANLKPVTFDVTPVRAQAIRLAGVTTNGGPNNSGSHMVSASTFYALVNHTETVTVPLEVTPVQPPVEDQVGEKEVLVRTEPIAITTRYLTETDPEKFTDEETEVDPGREGVRSVYQKFVTRNGQVTEEKIGSERTEDTTPMTERVAKRGSKVRPTTPAVQPVRYTSVSADALRVDQHSQLTEAQIAGKITFPAGVTGTVTLGDVTGVTTTAGNKEVTATVTYTTVKAPVTIEVTSTNEGWAGVGNNKDNVLTEDSKTFWASNWNGSANTEDNREYITLDFSGEVEVAKIRYQSQWNINQHGQIKKGYIEYKNAAGEWEKLDLTGVTGGTGISFEDKHFVVANPAASENLKPVTFDVTPVRAQAIRLAGVTTNLGPNGSGSHMVSASTFYALVNHSETVTVPVEVVETQTPPTPDVLGETTVVVRTEPIAITTRYLAETDPEKYTDEETEVSPGTAGVRTIYQKYETRNGVQTTTKIGDEYSEVTTQMEQRVAKRGSKLIVGRQEYLERTEPIAITTRYENDDTKFTDEPEVEVSAGRAGEKKIYQTYETNKGVKTATKVGAEREEITVQMEQRVVKRGTKARPTETAPRTFNDESSKVKVVVPAEETKDIVSLRVVHLETGHAATPVSLADKDYDLYDIELVNSQGHDVDITHPATVFLPVDAGKTVEQVLYLPETGAPDSRPFTETMENGQKVVTFTAEHFSKYSIVYRSAIVPGAYPPAEPAGDFVRDAAAVGRITDFTFADGKGSITFETGQKAQLSFYNDHVFRYYVDKEGNFPEHPALVHGGRAATITLKDQAAYQNTYGRVGKLVEEESRYILETEKVLVIFDKATSRMSVFDRIKNEYVTKEVEPVKLTPAKTTQTLSQGENEQFFGGGMQNGRFTHKGNKIRIVNENNWVDNGVASPAPFYWSSNGYGVLRNTFVPGQYDFGTEDTSKLTSDHNEERFDAYYFVNSKPADILKDYYELTGKPIVLPLYALYLGHLNAYNRDYWREVPEGTRGAVRQGDGKWYREFDGRYHTPETGDVRETLNGENGSYEFSARRVIERYKEADMPMSWFLPNDGYGAGFGQGNSLDENIENLKKFVEFSNDQGIAVGLWTQSDMVSSNGAPVLHRDIEKEVAIAGTRIIKTDVAWVGPGYNFGLNGVDEGARRLTEHSGDERVRPFIVSLDGWAGTQRSAAIWSGDQSGGEWEYIRFHIPTYLGLGLSGNPNIGSDMDGIFGGGNPIINARDYQWKTFTSILMNMDGWGREPKMPFAFGDAHPTTDVNRMSLKLKSTLIPYAYSTGHQASEDGKPILRAMFFETPEEAMAYTKAVQYQYMYGDNFLVAPVYEPTALKENGDDIRNNIFLPAGSEWLDFYTGKKYEGGQVLNGFEAPLWKIPVFVKNGAIVPMANAHNNPSELDKTNRLITFYPHGTTSFKHYEDDGTSVDYKSGKVATTLIESTAGDSNTKGTAVLKINRTQGEFDGMVKNKTTELHVNVSEDVTSVEATVNGQAVTLRRVSTLDEYNNGTNVFFYHNDPTMATYAPKSDQFKNLSVTMNDLLKVKLAASDVTAGDTVVTINGFINKKEEVTVPAGLEKPAVPTNLATPEAFVTATSMKVSWSPSDRAETYDLLHNDVLYTNIKGTEFTFKDFTPGSEHTYKVRAVNAKGVSDWSDAVTTQTSEDPWLNAIDIEPTRVSTNIVAQGGQGIDKLVNKQKGDQFHSQWNGTVPQNPYIRVDLGGVYDLDYVEYHQRGDGGVNGRVTWARFYVSEDGENWTQTGAEDWRGDGNLKRHTLNARGRYVHMAIEGHHGQWVSGEELLIFKKPGTKMLVPGDINNDGRINEDDKTSFMNYSGLRTEDNDFQYIQHVDSNKNGIIDTADISVIATQLDGGITSPSTVAPSGNLRFEAEKLTAAAGEEIKVYLVAEDLAAVNALTSTFQVNGDDFEVVRNVVVPETFVKQAENFSQIRTRGTTVDAVFSFVNFGQKDLLSGSGRVAYLTLKAKRAASLNFTSDNGVLVGNDLRNVAVADQPVAALVNYTAVPTVPTAVTVERPTHGSVTLSWTASDNAARYVIEQEGEGGQFVEVGRSNTTSFNVYNLAPETSYKFRVRATNPLGESANTDLVTGTTVAKDITNKLTPVAQAANTPEQPGEGLARFFDGDESTIYHSQWGKTDAVPSSLIIDLGEAKSLDRLIYVPRPAASNGTITGLTLETSNDGETWAPTGETIRWTRNSLDKIALFPRGTASRYIRINWASGVGGFVSGQELYVIASTETTSIPEPIDSDRTFRDVSTDIDFMIERIPDANLSVGEEVILREGRKGQLVKVYADTVVNGQTISEFWEIKDFRLPLSKIVRYGTRPVVTTVTTPRSIVESIDFTVERIPVPHLDAGQEVLVREGVAGRLTKVYEDTVTTGSPTVSRLVEVRNRVAPISKLILVGTRPVVTTRTETREVIVDLPLEIERVETETLEIGTERVLREGRAGRIVHVYEDTYTNGVKTNERVISVKEAVVSVKKLVLVGIRPVVATRTEIREVTEYLPVEVERVASPTLKAGEERVIRQGRPGQVTKVYEDTYTNGVKTAEHVLEIKEMVVPTKTVVLVGEQPVEQPTINPSPRLASPFLAKLVASVSEGKAPVTHFKSEESSDIESAPVAISAVGILSTLGLIGTKKKD